LNAIIGTLFPMQWAGCKTGGRRRRFK